MSMQSFAFLLHVVAQYAPAVTATRVQIIKSNGTMDHASVGSGSVRSCLYECGADEVSVQWEREDESDGSLHSMSSSFTIGAGAGIKYKPTQEECLSQCQVVDVNSKRMCRSLRDNPRKVSKNAEYKLCCVPRRCKFDPKKKVFEPQTSSPIFGTF